MRNGWLVALLLSLAEPAAPPVFTYGLSLRVRPELRTHPSLEGSPELDEGEPADLAFVGSRFRASLGLAAFGPLRLFGQIQDARRFGSEAGTTADEATLDVHQAYGELSGLASGRLDLRLGRFELAYGDERLIGTANWLDTARTFDGGLVRARPRARNSTSPPATAIPRTDARRSSTTSTPPTTRTTARWT